MTEINTKAPSLVDTTSLALGLAEATRLLAAY